MKKVPDAAASLRRYQLYQPLTAGSFMEYMCNQKCFFNKRNCLMKQNIKSTVFLSLKLPHRYLHQTLLLQPVFCFFLQLKVKSLKNEFHTENAVFIGYFMLDPYLFS